MKRTIPLFTSLSFVLLLIGCSPQIDDFQWIEGTWKRTFNTTDQFEVWTYNSDTLKGLFFYIHEGDTFATETKKVYKENREVVLNIIPTEQNVPQILFLESAEEDFLSFKNEANTYPTEVTIALAKADQLTFTYSATVNGFKKGVEYEFTRLN